ncbi:kinase-like protein [Coprinellus micaceus]|uniref:Kinase-like protein n=1 Tax=Coprinellus micaceus TaxID=71717 RepID=A0A4Y7SQF1_COPMI|nr:kinase-like protein [Coprinellus micaceus]
MPPSDLEKNERSDFVQSAIDDLAARTEGAKMLEVVRLLKIITSAQIKLEPAPGSSDKAPVYHSFASGGYADIFKATMACDDGSTKTVAVKVFRGAHLAATTEDKKELYKNRLRREYEVWGRAEHRNVLRLEGLLVCDILPSPGLVSEYKEHGDLLKFMQLKPTFDRLAMARDIACGLQYLHSQNVVHGDLTPLNILVDVDRATGLYFPLITDFGKSRIHEMNGYTTNMNTTPMAARPPELLAHADPEPATNKGALTFGSDVYSFSLLLLQLITDKVPFKQEGKSLFVLISQITDEENPLRPTPKHYPLLSGSHDFCWPIMQACWKHSPKERITSREVYERLCKGSPSTTLN